MDGSVFTCISAEPLDLNHYANLVAAPAVGAISSFSGVTRNNFGGKAVLRLEYEAYIPMAMKKLDVRGSLQQACVIVRHGRLACVCMAGAL